MGLGRFNPHREYDPEKGSLAVKVTGIATQISGAALGLGGAAVMTRKNRRVGGAVTTAVGGLAYYAGTRTYKAGKKRKPIESPSA